MTTGAYRQRVFTASFSGLIPKHKFLSLEAKTEWTFLSMLCPSFIHLGDHYAITLPFFIWALEHS